MRAPWQVPEPDVVGVDCLAPRAERACVCGRRVYKGMRGRRRGLCELNITVGEGGRSVSGHSDVHRLSRQDLNVKDARGGSICVAQLD